MELESKVVSLFTKIKMLEYTTQRMKQYSRHNSILIHGLPEVKGKDTDSLDIKTVKEKMGLDISSTDIEKTHPIGAPPRQSGKVRPVIAKFVRYNTRKKII